MISSGCSFGVLARVPIDAALDSSSSFLSRALKRSSSMYGGTQLLRSARSQSEEEGNDLLLACSSEYLHVFMRKIKNMNCSCHENDPSSVVKNGFQCPHVSFYEDFWPHGAIPWTHLTQIYMTYRTTNNTRSNSSARSIATRTKDMLLEFTTGNTNSKQLFWLEFEHNLTRGGFLDEIIRLTSSMPVDVEYIDLNERNDLKNTLNLSLYPPFPFKTIVSITSPPPARALQVSSTQSTTTVSRESMTVPSKFHIALTNTMTNPLDSMPSTPQDVVELNFEEFVTLSPANKLNPEATAGIDTPLEAIHLLRPSVGPSRLQIEANEATAEVYVHSAVEAFMDTSSSSSSTSSNSSSSSSSSSGMTQDQSALMILTEPEARFAFLRDALRCVLIQKLKTTLQVVEESNAIVVAKTKGKKDKQIQCLLTTCMELSSVLDEPDLFVLTLVLMASVEKFLHPQQAFNKMFKALEMAQQNSFDMLVFLSLQCLVEWYLHQENFHQAIQLLKQLSKQIPDQMQHISSTIKMEIHKRIHTLRDKMSPYTMKSTTSTITTETVFSESFSSSSSCFSSVDVDAAAKCSFQPFKCVPCISFFLSKVYKKALHRGSVATASGSLYVEIQSNAVSAISTSSSPRRYRVFYDGFDTMLWLQEEITRRHAAFVATTSSNSMVQEVESFVNPSDGKVYRFSDRIMQCTLQGQLILARMAPVTVTAAGSAAATATAISSRAVCSSKNDITSITTNMNMMLAEAFDMMKMMTSSSMDGITPTSKNDTITVTAACLPSSLLPPGFLTCSLCHQLVHFDQVEEHSEVCFG
jgi:hypothetical protein